LPALGCSAALILLFIFSGLPVGFLVILIIGALVLRRAGPWWRRAAAPAAMVAAGA